jgi:hypothetical protein
MENQPWQKETSAPPHFPLLVPLSLKNQKGKLKKNKEKGSTKCRKIRRNAIHKQKKMECQRLTQTSKLALLSEIWEQTTMRTREPEAPGGDSAQRRRQRDKEDEALAFCQRGRGRGRGLNTHQNRRPVPVMIDTRNVFQPTPIHIPRRNSTRLRNASARYLVVSITTTSNGRQCKLTLSDGRRYGSLFMPVWDDG